MSISEKYAVINGKSVNVYTQEQFFSNKEDIDDIEDNAGVEIITENNEKYVLPVRISHNMSDRPGIYTTPHSPISFIREPKTGKEKKQYSPEVVDFRNAKSIQDVIDMNESLDVQMNTFLETDIEDGNTYKPNISSKCSPEMRGLKCSLIEKKIDINKYSERFGPNWINAKRKLQGDDISLFLLKRFSENFDLGMDLMFYDANPDVPNPMGKIIRINVIPGTDTTPIIEDAKREKNG